MALNPEGGITPPNPADNPNPPQDDSQDTTQTPPGDEGAPDGESQVDGGGDENGSEGGSDDGAPERPEWMPEKFWNDGEPDYEALAKSYAEAEKKLSERTDDEPPQKTEEELAAERDAAQKTRTELRDRAASEYQENGEITEDTYKAFEADGISREEVDRHIEGQRAIFELRVRDAREAVGGKDALDAMQEWGATNMTAEEIEAYNDAVFRGTPEQMAEAVSTLKTKYEEHMGTDGTSVTDGNRQTPTGDYFKSHGEWMAALNDKRYETDEAYRNEVAKKAAKALENGVDLHVSMNQG